ncbi:MAG: class I SAM-dependent methyltransferase [bacterium]|nr:MAG: class I SAM-dependent methyltransferase [bacterium]
MGRERHRVCPWYEAYLFDNPLRRLVHSPARILGPYVDTGMTVLDIGCGMGFFSLAMARLVGPEGRVFALDIQPQMLRVLKRRAMRADLMDRIETRLIGDNDLGLDGGVDFVLAFWMVHEVPDQESFLRRTAAVLNHGAKLLIAEPFYHVKAREMEEVISVAARLGLTALERPKVRMSRAVVLERKR